MSTNSGCTTQEMLQINNPRAHQLKTAGKRIRDNPPDPIGLKILSVQGPSDDHMYRRYNRPTANEVAVISPGREGDPEETGPRDLIIEHRNGVLQRILELNSAYLPLLHPILFPYGEQGWHINLNSIAPYLIQCFASNTF